MTLAYAYVAIVALSAAAQAPLEPVATIPMPGVKGRIDHFAIDVKAHRLFVAALGNDTVEVLDVAATLDTITQGLSFRKMAGLRRVTMRRSQIEAHPPVPPRR